jgi:histidinol-phosphate aminotransferase
MMTAKSEKGGGSLEGIRLLLCENPLPPIEEAIQAARDELVRSNYYTEPCSAPLRRLLSDLNEVPEHMIHINAGSELILRQIFQRFGQRVHLLTPTYSLFPEIATKFTETRLSPDKAFHFNLDRLDIPEDTSLVVIVNPNNPTGGTFDMNPLPMLLREFPRTHFLVDEAFIGLAGQSVASWVPRYENLLVTRTFSKAHSLAGLRIGYAFLPPRIAADLNIHNDSYPLARPSQAAAIASLLHEDQIRDRANMLRGWTQELAAALGMLGVKVFPTETYFFLADFSPHSADDVAAHLKRSNILIKPLNDLELGPGYIRVTTALPKDNQRFVTALEEILGHHRAHVRQA